MKPKKKLTVPLCLAAAFVLLGAFLMTLPGVRFSAALSLCLAALCVLWAVLCRLEGRGGVWRALKRLMALALACLAVLLAGIELWVVRLGESDVPAAPADAVLVLGAGVNGTTPSMALQTRINKAADYLMEHPELIAVLSGCQGAGEDISEAQAIYNGLVRRGVSGARLILEERSVNTSENFAYSKLLLAEAGIDVGTAAVAVVTNDFHMARAGLIGARQGYGSLVRVGAELPWWWLTANYYLREAFAVVKTALFDW